MPFSHHSHSGQFCKHAAGSLEEVVLEAIRQKFIVFGLTEHVPRYRPQDRYPEEVCVQHVQLNWLLTIRIFVRCSLHRPPPSQANVSLEELEKQFDMFVEEAHRLKVYYASEITLVVGAETELITDADCVGLQALLNRHGDRIEYLVGSIHHVNEIPIDYDQATFQSALDSLSPEAELETESRTLAMGALLDHYLDAQYELMVRFRPEVIGHMDLCRLYNPQLEFSRFPSAMEKLERNIKYACEYGALIEFNAAAFRKGWDAAYPGRDVLEVCRFPLTFTTCAETMPGSPLC